MQRLTVRGSCGHLPWDNTTAHETPHPPLLLLCAPEQLVLWTELSYSSFPHLGFNSPPVGSPFTKAGPPGPHVCVPWAWVTKWALCPMDPSLPEGLVMLPTWSPWEGEKCSGREVMSELNPGHYAGRQAGTPSLGYIPNPLRNKERGRISLPRPDWA